MKYTKNERLEIGRRIYSGEISRFQAAEEYGISEYAARDYMRLYRDVNNLPPKRASSKSLPEAVSVRQVETLPSLEDYQSMSKEELILELMRSRIREARAKKGYEVKGAGAEKVFVLLDSENTR